MKNTLTFNKLNIVDCVDSLNDGSNELWLHFQKTTSVAVAGHGIIIADPDIKINSSWYLTSDLILNIDGRIVTIKHPTTTTGQMMVRRVSDNIYQLSFGGESGIVDITPVLTEGVEIAQYTIDGETGSIYAPEGVSKEYVDDADLEIKKEAAKASNDKYDESVIPSQYDNKLYVYGNPESMYPAADIGGEMPAITGGHCSVDYNWWGTQVDAWQQNDYKIFNNIYNRLFFAKCINQSDNRYSQYIIACFDENATITTRSDYDAHPEQAIYFSGNASKLYIQNYSGDPQTPQGYNEDTNISTYSGGDIADFNFENNQYYGFSVTGIPVFVVNNNNQSEFDKINYYIQTGDYSNAVNYSELYPDNPESYVAIDVISGDWYKVVNNAWVKQGTLELNETSGIDAEDVDYDNTQSGLIADNVQDAIDELADVSLKFVIDSTDNGINIVYDDSILSGGE